MDAGYTKANSTRNYLLDMACQHEQESILIVDTDVEFASSLQRLLCKGGYRVSHVKNGVDALQRLTHEAHALVIMDCCLDAFSGLDLAAAIRRQRIPCRILLLGAFGKDLSTSAASKVGADAYLSKPVRRDEVMQCIATLLTVPLNTSCCMSS